MFVSKLVKSRLDKFRLDKKLIMSHQEDAKIES